MAQIYKRLPNISEDQHEDMEGILYRGTNLEAITEFIGYVPAIANKHKQSLQIVNSKGNFQLCIGQWVIKGILKNETVFYVMDHSIVARRWNVDAR